MKIYCEDLDEDFCLDIYLTYEDLENLKSGIMLSRDSEFHGCVMSVGIIPSGKDFYSEEKEIYEEEI